jgi:predicted amidohydrolase
METSPFVLGLQTAAKESSLAINVGIHVPAGNGKLANRSCWINEHGNIVAFYDKLHLFDYGALKESNSVEAGKKIVLPVETVVGRVGLTICFDVSSPRTSYCSLDLVDIDPAPIPGNQPSSQTSKCSNNHLSFRLHCTHRQSPLGSAFKS